MSIIAARVLIHRTRRVYRPSDWRAETYAGRVWVPLLNYHRIETSLCWASFVGSQHDATRVCCWAPAHAAIDRYFLPTGRSAANPPAAVAAVNRWDRRTDRHPTVAQTHAMRAASTRDRQSDGLDRCVTLSAGDTASEISKRRNILCSTDWTETVCKN